MAPQGGTMGRSRALTRRRWRRSSGTNRSLSGAAVTMSAHRPWNRTICAAPSTTRGTTTWMGISRLPNASRIGRPIRSLLGRHHLTAAQGRKEGDPIAAHGNSIRALVKYLDHVPDDEIVNVNIPTGVPLIYELDDDLEPLRHYYLGNQDEVEKAMATVASQGRSKH